MPLSIYLSVVVPTYNRKDSLRLTLDGLERQSYARDRFEVIVVSDGSTDGTSEFVNQYKNSASYTLRFLEQANSGPARARNYGIHEANGDVIVMVDDDVEPAPKFLEAHAKHHTGNKQAVVIGPMSPDPKRRRQEPVWIAWEHAMLQKQYEAFRQGVWDQAGPHNFYSGNASLRKEHLLAVGGFNEEFKRQEDVELAVRLQRERKVEFIIDLDAVGIHRPQRNFAGWLNVAASYGRLDVIRARNGDGSWETISNSYHHRNRVTQTLASITLSNPSLNLPLRSFLKTAAIACYRLGLAKPAISALSVVYNMRYLECAQEELGRNEMRKLIG